MQINKSNEIRNRACEQTYTKQVGKEHRKGNRNKPVEKH